MPRRKSTLEVQVGRFGRPVKTVEVDRDSTVEDVLEEAELSVKSSETITLNGDSVSRSEEVEDGDIILLTRNVQGGR